MCEHRYHMQLVGAMFDHYQWIYTYNEWLCWDCGKNQGRLITSKNWNHPRFNQWFTEDRNCLS